MFKDEGYQFMAAAFEVYNQLGYGMAEEVHQQCLEVELDLRQIPFRSKDELAMYYKGRKLETRYKPDLFAFGGIVVGITRQPVGYLVNFGRKGELEWKRFILSDLRSWQEQ